MKKHHIVSALTLTFLLFAALCQAAPGPLGLVTRTNSIKTFCSSDRNGLHLATRKKLVYFLELDPMSRRRSFDLSAGKPIPDFC
jgi:hypothetical protein